MTSVEPGDDPSIPGTERLYRRVPPSQAPYDQNRQRLWPSTASLLPSAGDNEVSVYLASIITELQLDAIDVLEGHENYGLICFPASSARAAGYGVKSDPVVDSDRPLKVDPAHAVLTGTPLTSKQRRKPARTVLADGNLMVLRDPVGES